MLRVYHSNRLERLLERLITIMEEAPGAPLAPEFVITQSQGMARWLSLSIAEKTGISANVQFSLPAAFVWRMFMKHLPGLTDTSGFDRRVLAWRLMGLLPEALEKPVFAPLRNYLNGNRPEVRRWQLCRQIADVFDQYLIYRPDMLLNWERGEEEDWQAQAWRALASAGDHSPHRAVLWEQFLRLCDRGALIREELPSRVAVFGISTLPPAYFEVLRRVAEVIDVHMFVLNPCEFFWGDIEAPRNITR